MKPVKYLVSGWYVLDGIYKPFKEIVTEYDIVKGYLEIMRCRNNPDVHTKVDNIECIWDTD